ncbi:Radical SAM protein [Nitrospira japonica]|uniref:Radical SAM protein n=1 Tax=Nitrospira japonica TaxID=1325564 RepID=A0A1W1I6F8_9BACT|nr:His-Xaa-Ser system radical SAM maturase HxsB [Nitrospira japonica]SLM48459.1 Radical SAM protein [Nitrospira japonica]
MSHFQGIEHYQPSTSSYRLLPFRFSHLQNEQYVLTNLAGEYWTTERSTLLNLLAHRLQQTDPAYCELRARHFLMDASTAIAPQLLSIKLRTRNHRLAEFTGLHLFVVTLRCEHSCPYCQVSRRSQDTLRYDMGPDAGRAALALALRSPSTHIKIEFQGGEPLLNFPLIQTLVLEAKERNRVLKKELAFVIATNLALITEEMLTFCRDHSILISTSLDGPRDLHNQNRPRPGGDSYERTIRGITLARESLGHDQVSALMTTTEASLSHAIAIIDEYVAQGFKGIFLRPLSPYGFAIKTRSYQAYNTDRWLTFFKEGLEHIIELNRRGHDFSEYYASTILKKMLTSDDPGYVDLMSPAGIGIGAVVYNYDGHVYASDESRMLAEMGKEEFKLGHVLTDTYKDIFTSSKLLDSLEDSFAYSNPMCHDCAFEPYCGADPVYHYAVHGDYVGRKPESEFCKRNMEIFRYLILKMEKDSFVNQLFTKWANR